MIFSALCLSCGLVAAPIIIPRVPPVVRPVPYVHRSAPRKATPAVRKAPEVDRSLYNTNLMIFIIAATPNHAHGTTTVTFRCGDEEYTRTASRDVTSGLLNSWCDMERGEGWKKYERLPGEGR